jgi:DNA-binding protein YbaB
MPVFDIPKNYQDGADLTESMLDDAFEYVETALNTTKIDYQNIQSGGIIADNLASNAIVEAKVGAGAITVNKLGDGAVTTIKIADDAVTADKLAASAVVTDSMVDGAVTQAKRAALGHQISNATGYQLVDNSGPQAFTNLSVSITTTGRPVFVGLISDGNALGSFISENSGSDFYIYRGETLVTRVPLANATGFRHPPSVLSVIDVPAAGTYTYTIKGKNSIVAYVKMVAYEL